MRFDGNGSQAVEAMLSDSPLQFLTGAGPRAYPVVTLTWVVIAISIAVMAVITALVAIGLFRRRAPETLDAHGRSPLGRKSGLAWIYIGTGISTVVLLAVSVWNMVAIAAIAAPPGEPAATIEIRGHQWWWEIRYLSDDPTRVVQTANDFHIPMGKPIHINLVGADVIHSFWIPALSGKMDMIPGQTNMLWIQADRPGTYRGQCTEYCGKQHAHMGFTVTAEPEADYQAWLNHLRDPAPAPATPELAQAQGVFVGRCGQCHAVDGSPAKGQVAPNLSHLMLRKSLAAGTLNNNPVQLSGWIADPQHIKPGCDMPWLALSGGELASVRSYLETLN